MTNGAHEFRKKNLELHVSRYRTAEEFLEVLNSGLRRNGEKELDASYLSQLRSSSPSSRNIGAKTARKLELGLDLETGSFDRPIDDDSNPTLTDLDAQEVARKWRDLSPDQQALVRQTIETLRKQNL